jgi:uncharacterized SAM-binding protein YcdF (DUF218 family)
MRRRVDTQTRLRQFGRWTTWLLIGIAAVLVIAELILNRHGKIPMEDLPLFPAVFGFMALLLVVLGGIGLRKLLMRGEDYYGDH